MAGPEGFRLPPEVDIDNRRSLKTTERYDEQHLKESRREGRALMKLHKVITNNYFHYMYSYQSLEIANIVIDFGFLIGLNFWSDKIQYGMRAYPSLSFVKRLGEVKWLEFHIVGSDYGTEDLMPPYHIYLCQYYKVFGIHFLFQTKDIPVNHKNNEYKPTQSLLYLKTISALIENDKDTLELLKKGW